MHLGHNIGKVMFTTPIFKGGPGRDKALSLTMWKFHNVTLVAIRIRGELYCNMLNGVTNPQLPCRVLPKKTFWFFIPGLFFLNKMQLSATVNGESKKNDLQHVTA